MLHRNQSASNGLTAKAKMDYPDPPQRFMEVADGDHPVLLLTVLQGYSTNQRLLNSTVSLLYTHFKQSVIITLLWLWAMLAASNRQIHLHSGQLMPLGLSPRPSKSPLHSEPHCSMVPCHMDPPISHVGSLCAIPYQKAWPNLTQLDTGVSRLS
jgi:hypothetical protein